MIEIDDPRAKVLIVVPHYWGKADSISDAWKQVKKYSHKHLQKLKSGPHKIYVVFDTEEQKSFVDEYGMLHSPSDHSPICIEAHNVD